MTHNEFFELQRDLLFKQDQKLALANMVFNPLDLQKFLSRFLIYSHETEFYFHNKHFEKFSFRRILM